MKKLLLGLCLIVMIGSCSRSNVTKLPTTIRVINNGSELNVIVIENCEYLELYTGNMYSLCHKGNCKNSIHTYNQK